MVSAEIVDDRYLKVIGDVGVTCSGCHLATPFRKVLKKNIR
jgi:hypothetical protein